MKSNNSKETKNKTTKPKAKTNEIKKKNTKPKASNIKNNKMNIKKEETKKTKKNKKKLIINILLITIISGILLGIIGIVLFIMIIVKEAPEFDPKNLYTQESSIVYDGNGNEIAKLGSEKREKITYDAMPQILVDAIVATEDSTFFQHNGFNAARFLKASLSQIVGGGGGGASTLTMQVSKNAYTSNVSNGFEGIKRKFTDIYLSIFKIEKTYTKEEIMEFYVNSYYMGGGAYGVEQACQNYFGKSVNNINLAEAAMLAGIYQAPGSYDPTINPENTEARRKTVLNLMLRHGYITQEEKEIAEKLTVDKIIKTKNTDGDDQVDPRYKDFIDTLIEDVKKKTGYNPYSTPMLIYTTMDNAKQEYITNLMNGNNFNWENDKVQAGIAVIDTNTGAVVAIGAGRHRENEVGWNYATMNRRHIGSTAKPLYDYGPIIEYKDASTYKLYYDEPYSYTSGTSMNNWDGRYSGLINMREALKVSRNVPALKTFQENDNSNIYEFVTKLGLSPETEDGFVHEAHSIGAYGDGKTTGENPLSVAAAYAAFANGGYYTEPYTFTKIIYRNSDEEYIHKPERVQVMSDATAYMITDMLISTSGYATGATSVNGITYGSKTGTSNFPDEIHEQYHLRSDAVNDLWVAGFCRDFSTAVWYGYDSVNSDYYNTMGSGGNTKLYKQLIQGIYTGTPNFTKPSSVVSVTVEKNSPGNGQLPSAYTPDGYTVTELFKAGTEPTTVSSRFEQSKDVKNLKATVKGNKVQLSWEAADTPNALNIEFLKNQYKDTCRNLDRCASIIHDQDSELLGVRIYQIYLKNADGSLKLLHGTQETHSEETIPSGIGNKATFVVKASFASNGKMESNGIEVSADITNAIKIEAKLNGSENIEVGEVETYKEQGVTITEGGTNVTNSASIKITYTLEGKPVNEITSETGHYEITYTIKYKDFNKTLTRKVFKK
jgi:penicillin-binding protein 1A